MLRKIRITLATICFVLINLLFLGVSWGLSQHIAWVAKIQFLPALLALDYAVLIVLIAVTLLFGGKKIPELMKGLGKGVKSFKDGMKEGDEEPKKEDEEIRKS